MSFDLFIYAGGYWSENDTYAGGTSFEAGRHVREGFHFGTVAVLLNEFFGYSRNMTKIAWFPPDNSDEREEVVGEACLENAVNYGISKGALTLYIVRENDPYLSRRIDSTLSALSDDEGPYEDPDYELYENDGSSSHSEIDLDVLSDDMNVSGSLSSSEDEAVIENREDTTKTRKFKVSQEFKSIDAFKTVIMRYAVAKRRDIRFKKSDSSRVYAICSNGKCPWKIYVSINSSSPRPVVRSLIDEHNCIWQRKVSLLTNARITELYIEEFRVNRDFSAQQLQDKLMTRNLNVPWTICERTRLRCLQIFDQEQADSFARFFDYVNELKTSNPGSTVKCEVRESRFHRFYVCFEALKDGWKAACRKIIHIDGTFLKWRMTVVFEHLVDDLGLGTGNGLTLASDQQKGLIAAVKEILPFAEHRMCARHVYSNWKKTHPGPALEDMFWAAADSYYIQKFDRKMSEIKEFDDGAHDDLKISIFCPWSKYDSYLNTLVSQWNVTDLNQFYRAFFSEYNKCDAVENNLGESFNTAIRIARTKPVIQMLEEIRRRVMVSNEKKISEALKIRGEFTPRSVALLHQQIDKAKNCRPLSLWARLERNVDQDPKSLISSWFSVEKLRRCYQSQLQPVNDMNMWKVTTNMRVIPPHCSICRQEGHNKSKCTNQPAPKPPKKLSGKPRLRPLEGESCQANHAEASSQPLLLCDPAQPEEDLPSLSSALPRTKRGRLRKNQQNAYAEQQRNDHQEPIYDNGPRQLLREGYGVFTSPVTGDDYIHIGRSVRDTRDQSIISSALYGAREAKKQAVLRARGRGRARGSSQP